MSRKKPRKSHYMNNPKIRCSKCKKLAKDKINGEYLCRLHSPMRAGFK